MAVASLAAFSASSLLLLLLLLLKLACRLLDEDNNFLRALIARIKSNANSFSTPGTGDDDLDVVGMKLYESSVVIVAADADDFPRCRFIFHGTRVVWCGR